MDQPNLSFFFQIVCQPFRGYLSQVTRASKRPPPTSLLSRYRLFDDSVIFELLSPVIGLSTGVLKNSAFFFARNLNSFSISSSISLVSATISSTFLRFNLSGEINFPFST
ncbi:hypothetical protein PUN28_000526 [Cardiocondyla obscurior]|uniref:Uncharacterized protein n=1 Tax=Cardiocondyla obscurior TaxID=286306 RepID=A0AAW2GZY0_9HYME